MENKIPIKYVIELGLIRKRDKCAKCGEKMDVPNYNIQLCYACREIELDKYIEEIKEECNQDPKSALNHSQHPRIKPDRGEGLKPCVAGDKQDNGSSADTLPEENVTISEDDLCKCGHGRIRHNERFGCNVCQCRKFQVQDKGVKNG